MGKNALIYGLGNTLNRFITFLLLPLFTSYLTPHDFGVMAILGLVTLVLSPVFSLGLSAATAPHFFDNELKNAKALTIGTAATLATVNAVIFGILGCVFSSEMSQIAFGSRTFRGFVMLTISTISVTCISNLLFQYFQFEQRAKLYVSISTISLIITSSLNILSVVVLGWGVKGLLQTQLIGKIIALCLVVIFVFREIRLKFSRQLAKNLLWIGVPLVPSFAFFFILQDANRYLLQHWKGLAAVGIYSVGFNLGIGIRIAITAFEQSWLPFFMQYKDRQEEARILFGKLSTYYFFGFGALSMLFFIFAKPVIMIMTTPSFHDSYKIVGLSSTAAFFSGIYILLLPSFYFTKQVQFVSLVQAIAAVIALLLNCILIPAFGMMGAGIGLVLGMFSLIWVTYFWNQLRKGYMKIMYEWRRLALFFIIYVSICTATLFNRDLRIVEEILISFIALAVLSACLFVLLSENEKKAIMMRIRKSFNMAKSTE